ncbi:MAG: hypothetical protein V4547_18935 [Bacteroidota bacterium]
MRFLSFFRKLQYHTSIETMPIYSWFKLQETNDLTYLLKVKKECSKSEVLTLQNALQIMTNEYIDTFGINDQYKKILELNRDIFIKKAQLAMTGERINNTFINVLQAELNALLKSNQKSDTGDVIVAMSKHIGGGMIDTKKMTVLEFYQILNHNKKEVQASQKQ